MLGKKIKTGRETSKTTPTANALEKYKEKNKIQREHYI